MMTSQKYGILAAVQALRYAMLREGLSSEGITVALPELEYGVILGGLIRDFGAQMIYENQTEAPGFVLMGVRIISTSDITVG